MSIKIRLSLIMTAFAVTLLSINTVLSFFTTRDNLRKDSEANMMVTAKQIALAVEQSRSVYEYIKNGTDPTNTRDFIEETLRMTSPENITQESMRANDNLLEITGISPARFEQDQTLIFGTYQYKNDPLIVSRARLALQKGATLLYETEIDGKRVLDSFIPIQPQYKEPYVIRIISSYEPISSAISKHMLSQLSISIVLLQIVIFTSYILAGKLIRPVQHILMKISSLSAGDFDTRMELYRKDELGQLAQQIDTMADSIGHYMTVLRRKNEENQLMKEHLESIINQTADAIHVTDLDGNVLRVNTAFEELFGWSSEEIVGSRLEFIPPFLSDEREGWSKEIWRNRPFVLTETVRLRKDGSEVHVSISESPVYDEAGLIVAFISISRDMTEHNKMEELLRRSEKLTTVGQLAAGVAHEIRNPLTTLRGFLQMQQRTKSINQMHTDIMLSELDRINLIVSEFLILAKPQAVLFEIKDVRFTLGDVISLLDSEAHLHNIEFQAHFSSSPILVHCEENQLKQVFINVLKNAMEAMPYGGKITLSLTEDNGREAVIQVIDEGEGIPKERLERLGEPFYTNKEKGTGLGLMVTQRIIEGHKGKMTIDSEVGKGTVVTITLPRVTEINKPEDVTTKKSLA
ncbi:PAS domain S-box-containing protein [Fontibacillus phaseoli]|uniref:histidine kinase n=1 Tax=Fontibacillus phaseoli TaxID=1416533 RepID=A0A369B1K7_9BACL|nr:ATP-binding protein [Fontibacillus phaseoli]RCX14458.1 PAS domain S-box-containing protein [Fontibacillus phaseoli]